MIKRDGDQGLSGKFMMIDCWSDRSGKGDEYENDKERIEWIMGDEYQMVAGC